jgi:hypothetical protein
MLFNSQRDSSTDAFSSIRQPCGLILPIHSTPHKDMAASQGLIVPVDVIQISSVNDLKHLLKNSDPRQKPIDAQSSMAAHPSSALFRGDRSNINGVALVPRPYLPTQTTEALKFMRPLQYQIEDFFNQRNQT